MVATTTTHNNHGWKGGIPTGGWDQKTDESGHEADKRWISMTDIGVFLRTWNWNGLWPFWTVWWNGRVFWKSFCGKSFLKKAQQNPSATVQAHVQRTQGKHRSELQRFQSGWSSKAIYKQAVLKLKDAKSRQEDGWRVTQHLFTPSHNLHQVNVSFSCNTCTKKSVVFNRVVQKHSPSSVISCSPTISQNRKKKPEHIASFKTTNPRLKRPRWEAFSKVTFWEGGCFEDCRNDESKKTNDELRRWWKLP